MNEQNKRINKEEKYKILTLDPREIYDLSLIKENGVGKGFNIYKEDGKIEEKRFSSFLHDSLELKPLKMAYEKAKTGTYKLPGKFEINRRHPVYIRKGETVDLKNDLCDHVCVKDGRLIAIELPCENKNEGELTWKDTYEPVNEPCSGDVLEGLFTYDEDKMAYACVKDKRDAIKKEFDIVKKGVDGEYPLTLAVINVAFNSDEKLFNKKKSHNGYVFVRMGNEVNFAKDLCDHVCIRDGKLIAIEVPYETKKKAKLVSKDTYTPVIKDKACDAKYLEGYFKYDAEHECYVVAGKKIPTMVKRKDIRATLYRDGFTLGHDRRFKYVRYKRSAGSSRQGNCLFILEPLYKYMMEWSACGLNLDRIDNKIAKESYISLTLSNMKKEIVIPKESILVIPDATSKFKDNVVSIAPAAAKRNELSTDLEATVCTEDVENSIWDGQGLLDSSVFTESGYGEASYPCPQHRFP